MKIKVTSEEELEKIAKEALHILANLRHFTKLWNEHFGSHYKDRKKFLESKADQFIEKLQLPANRTSVKIIIENDAKENTKETNMASTSTNTKRGDKYR
jgi:putative sterol carrier protein